jgi:anti-sigma B factor antagonist
MSDQLVSVVLEEWNGSLLVRLKGEIDLSNFQQLEQQLESAVEGRPRVILDLAEVKYIDSQGLRVLKQLSNRAGREGTKLEVIARPDSFARQVLELTRMSEYIEIRDTLDG